MKKKGLIIFDMDGVIVDSVMLTYQYTKKSLPFMSFPLYQKIFDRDWFKYALHIYGKFRGNRVSKKLENKRSRYIEEKLQSRIIPGSKKLLETLSQHYELALNTNASIPSAIPILEKHDLRKFFGVIKTRENTMDKAIKNHEILEETGYAPKETLFITDSIRDVEDAMQSGICSIGMTTGVHGKTHFGVRHIAEGVVAVADNHNETEVAIKQFFKKRDKS